MAPRTPKIDARSLSIVIHPLGPERWDDLVDLFGPERGACAGCWCMWPRVRGVDFTAMSKPARREAFRALVAAGPPPGLLAYDGDAAIGWVAVGPRGSVRRFDGAKVSKPPEGEPALSETTWAITCFFVRPGHRRRGLMQPLASAAIAFARENGARAIDVCPVETDRPLAWGGAFVGVASRIRPLGFVEIARRSPTRPLLRLRIAPRRRRPRA